MRNRLEGLLGARVHLGLSENGMAVVRTGSGWRAQSTLLADQPLADNADQEPQRLAAQCAAILADAGCAGLPLCITLGDEWVRLFMVAPPQNASSLTDLQAAAAMRFQALYGESPSAWQLEADWNAGNPFLVCAMPIPLLAALRRIAADNKLPLLSIQPQFVAAWNRYCRALPADCWFGVVQERRLTLGVVASTPKRRLEAVRTIAISANDHDPRWLQDQLARVGLQLNLPTPGQLQLVGNQRQYWSATTTAAGAPIVRNLDYANGSAPATSLSAALLLAHGGLHA